MEKKISIRVKEDINASQKCKKKEISYGDFKTVDELLYVATWNVRGTFTEGTLIRLTQIMEKYTIKLMAIQETKQKGNYIQEIGNYIFFNSGAEDRMLGTGFVISKSLKRSIIDFTPISNRICKLRIRSKYRKISIINVHCLTEDKDIEEKEKFYEDIEKIYNDIPRYDVKMVMGDFNAKLGKEEMYKPVIGDYSKHNETNENGKKLIEFATERDLRIMTTYFEHKNIHKGTWISPDGRTINQIDHIAIESKHIKYILDARSYRGADLDTDHMLVRAKIKYRKPPQDENQGNTRIRYDVEKLKDEALRDEFQKRINKDLNDVDIETNWKDFEDTMTEGAQLLCTRKIMGRKSWFDDDCKEAIDKREKARMSVIKNNEKKNIELYQKCKKGVKALCRRKKREFIDNQIKNLETNFVRKQAREFYQGVKVEKGNNKHKNAIFCKDKQGNLIGGVQGSLRRWVEHFKEVFKVEERTLEQGEEMNLTTNEEDDEDLPTKNEIMEIINAFKNNKAPGENGISVEMLKVGGHKLEENLFKIIKTVWKKEIMPKRWKEALICPIHKKGDKTNCQNYRGIALIDSVYKIMSVAIKNRLNDVVENSIGQYQCGFRKNRSVMDQVFVLKQIIDNSIDQNLPLHILFIDFKQAFDSITREVVYKSLKNIQVKEKIIRLVKMTLTETDYKVIINGKTSEEFRVAQGLRQGDPLSTTLFNIVLDAALRESGIPMSGTIYNKTSQVLAYADDIALLTRTKTNLLQALKNLEKSAKCKGLKINETKTKYMVVERESENKQTRNLTIHTETERYSFEKVKKFSYLGVTINEKGDEKDEIEERIAKGKKVMGSLFQVLSAKHISKNAKKRIYKTVIRPVVTYGSEIWKMNVTERNLLEIFERKVLRRIYGGKKVGDLWIRRTNAELMEMYGEPSITSLVRAQRIRWLGHVARLQNERPTKQVLTGGITGRRQRGRPRSTWIHKVESDLDEIGVKDWRRQTGNRKKWKKISYKAMGLLGS